MSIFSNSNLEKLKSQVITLESRIERLEWKLEIVLNPSQRDNPQGTQRPDLSPTVSELKSEEVHKYMKDGTWTSRRCRQMGMVRADTERSITLEAIISYADPMTNTELAVITGFADESVRKQTAGLYSRGLLKRRANINDEYTDRYEYMAAPSAHRLLKKRNYQRKLDYGQKG